MEFRWGLSAGIWVVWVTLKCKKNIYKDSYLNTDSATSDLLCQKEVIHADVRQHAVVVEEEFLQVAGSKASVVTFVCVILCKSGLLVIWVTF